MTELPRLYVFTLSHFCEKARWACDRKGIPYRLITLLPGAHLLTLRRFSSRSQVPLLIHGERKIQDSSGIIDYLDATYPEGPLSPVAEPARSEARQWEAELDRELGETVRRVFYFHALQEPRYLAAEWGRGGPFWGGWFYALALPRMLPVVRKLYDVSAATLERDLARLDTLFERLDRHFAERQYLVGERFSRADLTLSALAAALLSPAEHPAQQLPQRATLPAWLEQTRRFQSTLTAERVREFYRSQRAFKALRARAGAAA